MYYKVSFYKKNTGYEVYNKVLHGFPIHETIDETLDSATIVCHTDDENKFKLWQSVKVEIWNGNNDEGDADYKKCFVIADIDIVERHTTKKSYTITLSLIEPTKYLEKVVCSSMSYTNKEDTLLDQLEKALVNAEPIRVGEEPRFKLAQKLKDRLSGVKGEDFFFTKPLLREVLDEMLSVVGFRVYVKEITDFNDIEIDFYDLNEVKEQIELQDVLNKQTIHNTEYLATDIEAYGDNSFSGSRRAIYHPSPNGWDTFKTQEATLTSENATIFLQSPLEEIEEFWLRDISYSFRYRIPEGEWVDESAVAPYQDIMSNVVDEETYNLLESAPGISQSSLINTTKLYKENTFYYNRENENIASYMGHKLFLRTTNNLYIAALNSIYKYLVENFLPTKPSGTIIQVLESSSPITYSNAQFRVKYVPYIDAHVRINKTNYNDVKSTIIDNQSEKIIDLGRYGNNLYGTINRLGNKEIKIDRKLRDMSEDYNIGDITKEGYILTSKTLALYNNFIKAHYIFTKDYNSIDSRIGINREKRIYNIPLEHFKRDILIHDFIVVSKEGLVDDSSLIREFMKTFNDSVRYPITNAVVATKLGENEDSPFYELTVVPYAMSTNILINFKFFDNYSAGMSSGNKVIGGIKQTPNPYVNENGEYNEIFISLVNDTFVNKPQDYNLVKELPKVDWGNYPINSQIYPPQVFKIYKDAFEHHSFTYELSIISNSKEIIVGSALAAGCALINEEPSSIRLFISTREKYTVFSQYPVGVPTAKELLINDNHIQIIGDYFKQNRSNIKSWGITLGVNNGNALLIGVNKVGDNDIIDKIYFNHKNSLY